MFIEFFFLHTINLEIEYGSHDYFIRGGSIYSYGAFGTVPVPFGTVPVFQSAVGYGTDPWCGSEMDMRLKFT